MRATAVKMSDMPGGKAYMGWWGELGGPKQKGITTYTISPFRQSAMRGALKGYLFGGFTRIAGHLPYVAVPFGLGYGIYAWVKRRDAWQSSKAGHLAMMEEGHHGH